VSEVLDAGHGISDGVLVEELGDRCFDVVDEHDLGRGLERDLDLLERAWLGGWSVSPPMRVPTWTVSNGSASGPKLLSTVASRTNAEAWSSARIASPGSSPGGPAESSSSPHPAPIRHNTSANPSTFVLCLMGSSQPRE
jgi:hypothetical protein